MTNNAAGDARPADGPAQKRSVLAALKGAVSKALRTGLAALLLLSPISIDAQSRRTDEPATALPRAGRGDAALVALGRSLFSDRRLSRSGTMSCSSCHDLTTSGASPRALDRGDNGQFMRFNTPTIFNAVYSHRLNWKGRTKSLPALVKRSFHYSQSVSGNRVVLERLGKDHRTVSAFRARFGRQPNLDDASVAISAYLETLVTPNAPFDRWLGGDPGALSAAQQRGYRRFKSLGCASCHQGVQMGGNLFQRSGIYSPLTRTDPGALRVPSLRNIAVTAPYFHDGSAATLPEAIARMGKSQLGVPLTWADIADIASFLTSLTGSFEGRALTAPRRP
jgi:cytochrome c peroxidase